MHDYERHVYERHFHERHAHERHAHERYAHERHAYGMNAYEARHERHTYERHAHGIHAYERHAHRDTPRFTPIRAVCRAILSSLAATSALLGVFVTELYRQKQRRALQNDPRLH
jgi:hypothetical protein